MGFKLGRRGEVAQILRWLDAAVLALIEQPGSQWRASAFLQLAPVTGLRATFLPMIDEATIAEAGRRISAAAPEARVILFGSHARAGADPQSDPDLLLVS